MRFLLVLAALAACVYFFLLRNGPAPQREQPPAPAVANTAPSQPAASPRSNFLKRPIDRAHEVNDQVRKRSEEKF